MRNFRGVALYFGLLVEQLRQPVGFALLDAHDELDVVISDFDLAEVTVLAIDGELVALSLVLLVSDQAEQLDVVHLRPLLDVIHGDLAFGDVHDASSILVGDLVELRGVILESAARQHCQMVFGVGSLQVVPDIVEEEVLFLLDLSQVDVVFLFTELNVRRAELFEGKS